MVEIFISEAAERDIERLPLSVMRRIRSLVVRLEKWSVVSGVKALRGKLANRYRLRTGDYRVQFRVQTKRTTDAAGKPQVALQHQRGKGRASRWLLRRMR